MDLTKYGEIKTAEMRDIIVRFETMMDAANEITEEKIYNLLFPSDDSKKPEEHKPGEGGA